MCSLVHAEKGESREEGRGKTASMTDTGTGAGAGCAGGAVSARESIVAGAGVDRRSCCGSAVASIFHWCRLVWPGM